MGIGDAIETMLTKVGITDDRVTKWLGRPCGCKERKEKLNRLGRWAVMVARGKIPMTEAASYLNEMLQEK